MLTNILNKMEKTLIDDKFIERLEKYTAKTEFIDREFRGDPLSEKINFLFDYTFKYPNEYKLPALLNHSKLLSDGYFGNILDDNVLRHYAVAGKGADLARLWSYSGYELYNLICENPPFVFNLYGAPFLYNELLAKFKMHFDIKKTIGEENWYLEDLEGYFKGYTQGFKYGIENYDEELKKHSSILYNDDYVLKKVTEKAIKDWFHHLKIETPRLINSFFEESAFREGQEMAYVYKSWSLIFSNPLSFLSIFDDLINILKIDVENDKIEKNKTGGRTKIKIKEVEYYLMGFEKIENKQKFLCKLKTKYKNVKPTIVVHLIKVLLKIGHLKNVSKKEYQGSFEKLLECKPTSPQNFNNQFKKKPDKTLFDTIETDIKRIIQVNTLV